MIAWLQPPSSASEPSNVQRLARTLPLCTPKAECPRHVLLQVDVQHLLYVLAACAIGLANSFSLGAAVLLRWLASSGALAAACVLAHFRPVWCVGVTSDSIRFADLGGSFADIRVSDITDAEAFC